MTKQSMGYFSMMYKKEEIIQEPCSWSEEYKTHIHRYDAGAMCCRCGKEHIKPKEEKGGDWRRK